MNIVLLHTYDIIKSVGPRALFQINSKTTVLQRQIHVLNKVFKNPEIVIVAGFRFKKIRRFASIWSNVSVIENKLYEETNELYSLHLAIKDLPVDDLLIIQNNLIFKEAVFSRFKKDKSQLFLSKDKKFEIGCTLDKNIVQNLSWSLPNYWINITYLRIKEVELLDNIVADYREKKWFLLEGLNYIIQNGGEISSRFIKGGVSIYEK